MISTSGPKVMEIFFNLRRLKAKNKPQEQLVKELLFADDSALVMLKHQKHSN